jgi:4-amino-4-deoxy-L-arabinose transferase-like glycosyltransferase
MLAWGLWLWRLDASDLTYDESSTYYIAHRPMVDMLEHIQGRTYENPPLYYVLIHCWMALAGVSEFSLRLFSVSITLISLALTGWLARLAIDRSPSSVCLLPAVLFAVAPGVVYYAREARMYSLMLAWTILSAGLFLRDWLPAGGWPRRAALFYLPAVHLLALSTHYYMILPILVQPLVLLVTRRWRPFLAWCAAHGFLALFALAWLQIAPGLQMTASGFWQRLALVFPTRSQVFRLLGKVLFSPVVGIHFRLLYTLLALTSGGLFLALWRRRAIGTWLVLALAVPLTLAFVLPHKPRPRYVLFLVPFITLALGYLCVTPLCLFKSRRLAWAVTPCLALVGVWLLTGGGLYQAITFDRSHYRDTLETVRAHALPGDGLLFYGPWQQIQLEYYDPGSLPPITLLPPRAPPHLDPAQAEPVLEELLARHDRLWVLPAAVDDVDPSHFAAAWLHTHAHPVWETDDFDLYLPPLPSDAAARQVDLTFGQILRLERVAYESQVVPAGEPIRFTLYWNPLQHLERDIWLALTLVDQTGHVWDGTSSGPGGWLSPPTARQPGDVVTDYEGLMVPQGAPPGEYAVRLVAHNGSEGPLLVEGEREIDLLKVQVTEPTHVVTTHPHTTAFCSPDGATCLTLAGYEPGGLCFQQGYPVPFDTHWVSPAHSLPELELRLRLVHSSWPTRVGFPTTPVLTRTLSLAPNYPTSLWSPGRLVTLPAVLTIPPDAPTGRAEVTLEVLEPGGIPWLTTEGASTYSLFSITVDERPTLKRLPAGLTPIQVDFGDEVGLRGYRVGGDPHPGGQLTLTYIWYARTQPTAIYAVFNHLVSTDGVLVAQADGWPQEGRMLTIQWQVDDYIKDSYTLAIPSDAPPGPYRLYTGLYDAATNERLPVYQDSQRLPEDQLTIPLPGRLEDDGK